jgi:hypothetical protein
MIQNETLLHMTLLSTRAYVGNLIRDEIARKGLNVAKAAELMGFSKPTLDRIMHQVDYPINDVRQRNIEGGLGFPRQLIGHILDGDLTWIKRLPTMSAKQPNAIDPDLLRSIVEALTEIQRPEDRRRRPLQ